jgi:hypothetical protein
MNIISHRGNINGPTPEKENRPSYIDCAIALGYDVEVDLRFVNENFWLGHDEPQYKIEETWMKLRKEKIWFHCKDIDSALMLIKMNCDFKYFCHTQDDYVITSTNNLWVHDLTKTINNNCIIPLLNEEDIINYENKEPYAICTDYVNYLKNLNYV